MTTKSELLNSNNAIKVKRKKTMPTYSHQDIREQYCINEKELQHLEATRKKPIFACLNSDDQKNSPCRRKSLIFSSCLKGRSTSDENLNSSRSVASKSPQRSVIDYDDETYFKRRPKTICYTDPKKLATLDDSLVSKPDSYEKLDTSNGLVKLNDSQNRSETALESRRFDTDNSFIKDDLCYRTSLTQPNTPNTSNRMRISTNDFDDRDSQKRVSFQSKSGSTPNTALLDYSEKTLTSSLKRSPGKQAKSDESAASTAQRSRGTEKLMSRPPEYYEQKALDQLLAPVLTKALMQEKMKRSCLRTQATQTDPSLVMKSLPHLPQSPNSERSLMISQSAQTNHFNYRKRRLVKSLSEASRYEGLEYDIYDLDGVPPPPPPPSKTIPQVLPLYPKEHVFWDSVESISSTQREESSSSLPAEGNESCSKCYLETNLDEDLNFSRELQQKSKLRAYSDEEMVKQQSFKYKNYIDKEFNAKSDDEFINPLPRDNRYPFDDEMVEDEQSSEGSVSDGTLETEEKLISTSEHHDVDFSSQKLDKIKTNTVGTQAAISTNSSSSAMLDLIGINFQANLSSDSPNSENKFSPSEANVITDASTVYELTDHFEESISESQITVLQKVRHQSSLNSHKESDSENSSFNLMDFSSSATTPSCKYMKNVDSDIKSEEHLNTVLNSSSTFVNLDDRNFSPVDIWSDGENATSIESQIAASVSTSTEADRTSIKSIESDNSVLRYSLAITPHAKARKDKVMDQLVYEIQKEGFTQKLHSRPDVMRKMASPDTDSSSSHFTEQETYRSPCSYTTTLTSKSDSHTNTDISETCENYSTAAECKVDLKASNSLIARKFNDDDLIGENKQLETSFDLTSPDGETTTSASYHVDSECSGSMNQFDLISPIPEIAVTFKPKEILLKEGNDEAEASGSKFLDKFLVSGTFNKSNGNSTKKEECVKIKNKKTREKSPTRNKHSKNEKKLKDLEAITTSKTSFHSEIKRKRKSEMKLDFPSAGASNLSLATDDECKSITSTSANEFRSSNSKDMRDTTGGEFFTRKNLKENVSNIKSHGAEGFIPSMVRSPAMHEGFRLEDWTPIRTPSTPKAFVEDSTKSIAPKEKPKKSQNGEENVSKRLSRDRMSKSFHEDFNDIQNHSRIPFANSQTSRMQNNFKVCSSNSYSATEPAQDKNVMDQNRASTDISSGAMPKSFSYQACEKICPITYSNDWHRQSGEFGCWNRQHDENFDPYCTPQKCDSLSSFSPEPDRSKIFSDQKDVYSHIMNYKLYGDRAMSGGNFIDQTISYNKPREDYSLMHERESRMNTISHRARSADRSLYARDWGVSGLSLELGDTPIRCHDQDEDERGLYSESYSFYTWLYVSPVDELLAWRKDALPQMFIPPYVRIPGFSYSENFSADFNEGGSDDGSRRSDSPDSTCSERDFKNRYQAVTHRLIHRKTTVEMYRKIMSGTFKVDKSVLVGKDSRGEFGFRIHGSRPVVVSAIESCTPAQTSGLEVGDIIVAINDAKVLESSHSDVVKLAHSGSELLKMSVARTCDSLSPLVTTDPTPVCAGYLYKLSGSHSPASGLRKWHRRWFELKKNHCLYHYKSEIDQVPLGAVNVQNYRVHSFADTSHPYAFTVTKFGGLTLYLSARTQEARNRWGQMVMQAAIEASQHDELLEETSRKVQQSPSAIATPDCFGYLFKLGTRWHQWKRRYCVLKDACLYFYQDSDATTAIGVVYIHGYRVQGTSIGGKKYAFELIPPESKFRHFYLSTDSENDRKRWLAGLEYSIERWIRNV